jgi:hypothetical protein
MPPDSIKGDYWKDGGIWYGWCPSVERNLLCTLEAHAVTEHENGTVTVSPSILCGPGQRGFVWHGFLEHGIWREV